MNATSSFYSKKHLPFWLALTFTKLICLVIVVSEHPLRPLIFLVVLEKKDRCRQWRKGRLMLRVGSGVAGTEKDFSEN